MCVPRGPMKNNVVQQPVRGTGIVPRISTQNAAIGGYALRTSGLITTRDGMYRYSASDPFRGHTRQ